MKLDDFNYLLPKELVAQRPADKGISSKLLICKNSKIVDFQCLVDSLTDKDVLIFNDTKVMPVVINGSSKKIKIKTTLLESIDNFSWKAFIKPARKVREGEQIDFKEGLTGIVNKKERSIVNIMFNLEKTPLLNYLKDFGNLPLPPYIKSKPNRREDELNYQTIFAKCYGAIASPTAGLHFNSKIIKSLEKKKINLINITLHIGLGTFLPLKQSIVSENSLHKERGIISEESAMKINKAIKSGKNIVAVGTTVMRLLEACHKKYGEIRSFNEGTEIFIYPGYKFNVVDKLLTNFHLPKSSLFILVSAFAGKDKIFKTYNYAIKNKMRFFSFGDAMLVEKNEI